MAPLHKTFSLESLSFFDREHAWWNIILNKQKKKKDNITIYRLDHKGDVGCSQNVFFLFESGTGVITLKLCMCKLHFILNWKLLPGFPPSPPPQKKGVPTEVKLSKPTVAHF